MKPYGNADYRELSYLMQQINNNHITGVEFLKGITKVCNGDWNLVRESWVKFLMVKRVRPRCIYCFKLVKSKKTNLGGRYCNAKEYESGRIPVIFCRADKGHGPTCRNGWTIRLEHEKQAKRELKKFMKLTEELGEYEDGNSNQ